MGITTDPTDDCIRIMRADGMQECYLVLSEEERNKEYVRPLRDSYEHIQCGGITKMAAPIAETYAANPKFYGGTFCVKCGDHFPLFVDGKAQFQWDEDKTPVGS